MRPIWKNCLKWTVYQALRDIRTILEDDSRRFDREDESFGAHGFGKQEFKGEELVDVEPEDDDFGGDDSIDLDDDIDFEE